VKNDVPWSFEGHLFSSTVDVDDAQPMPRVVPLGCKVRFGDEGDTPLSIRSADRMNDVILSSPDDPLPEAGE
jgi:hypothetical protein